MVTGVISFPRSGSRARWLIAPALLALAGIVAWWTWRALHDPHGYDFRLAYAGGQVAWATGHPELKSTWTGTPLLAAVMALVTRAMTLSAASDALTVLNAALLTAVVLAALARLRAVLSPGWWWIAALAMVSFAPMMSTVWWKQFNIVALVLAIAGFELLRRGRGHPAAVLIGVSVAVKPLAVLLPVVLLFRRETRRTGALALVWVAALTICAQVLLALRAHDVGVLSPIWAIQNFAEKTGPGRGWLCNSLNFSPSALVCRMSSPHDLALQRAVGWMLVALLGVVAMRALRARKATSWELFAFVCALSVMLSPLEWSHYQIMLAPLFVLLLVRFTQDGAPAPAWAGLTAAFALCALMWEPYGTSIGAAQNLFAARPESLAHKVHLASGAAGVAQFAQYVLLITGFYWYSTVSARSRARPRIARRERASAI